MRNVHFSSQSDDWETPQFFFDTLAKNYNFVLDVCATAENAKCSQYFSIDEGFDGLSQCWQTQGGAMYG